MVHAIADNGSKLVRMLSIWPETFSCSTFGAIAGADVACLENIGDVAETVRHDSRGVIAPDEQALLAFFKPRRAIANIRHRRRELQQPFVFLHEGTRATLLAVLA